MILTVLALGGAVLGATTIAGLLMLYQIREATDLANSGKAIYAADTGIEWTLYNWFCPSAGDRPCTSPGWDSIPAGEFSLSNGASAKVTQYCFDSLGNKIGDSTSGTCDPATNASSTTFKSLGTSGNSNRAFGLSF